MKEKGFWCVMQNYNSFNRLKNNWHPHIEDGQVLAFKNYYKAHEEKRRIYNWCKSLNKLWTKKHFRVGWIEIKLLP